MIKEVLLETDIKEVLSENEEFSWDILDTWHKNLSCVEE